jgi:hypothetical protein
MSYIWYVKVRVKQKWIYALSLMLPDFGWKKKHLIDRSMVYCRFHFFYAEDKEVSTLYARLHPYSFFISNYHIGLTPARLNCDRDWSGWQSSSSREPPWNSWKQLVCGGGGDEGGGYGERKTLHSKLKDWIWLLHTYFMRLLPKVDWVKCLLHRYRDSHK